MSAAQLIPQGPEPREIPPGKVLLAEYGEHAPGEMATVRQVFALYSTRIRATIRLVAASAGYVPAGSIMSWRNPRFIVQWEGRDGCRHGQEFPGTDAGLSAAVAYINARQL